MSMKEIIVDSIKYPFSNWKNFFLLGIILYFCEIPAIAYELGLSVPIQFFLFFISVIFGLLVNGYLFRVLGTSLEDLSELPDFDNWEELFKDGIKVFIVCFVYSFPAILIILNYTLISDQFFLFLFEGIGYNPAIDFTSITVDGMIWCINGLLTTISVFFGGGHAMFGVLYMFIITPLLLIAITNMADYNGEFQEAFRIGEIVNEISMIGWIKMILWYITLLLVSFILLSVGFIIRCILSFINLDILQPLVFVFMMMFIFPFYYLFVAKSLALLYISD